MVSTTIAGARYGLTLVWALAAGVVVKLAITEGGARWQLATGIDARRGLAQSPARGGARSPSSSTSSSGATPCRVRWSPRARWCRRPCSRRCRSGCGDCCMRSRRLRWSTTGATSSFSRVIKWFVGLKFGAIMATVLLILFWSGADWSRAGASQPISTPYILSLIGGVGGTVTLLSYGYWMREEGWSRPRAHRVGARRSAGVVLARHDLLPVDDLPGDADQLGGADPRRRPATLPAAGRSHRRGDRHCRAGRVPVRVLGRRVLVGPRRLARRPVPLRRLAPPVAADEARWTAGRRVSQLGGRI